MDRFDADRGEDGVLSLITFDPATAFPRAATLLHRHPLRTLDALHLAVALTDAAEVAATGMVFVSLDTRQGAAAEGEGLSAWR